MANHHQFHHHHTNNRYGIIGTTPTSTNHSSGIYNNSSRSLAESYFSNDPSLFGASRYLTPSSDSLSSVYKPNYGPPGVDVGPNFSANDSIYAGLKRTPPHSLYHQTLLGARNTIGQNEAWYSADPLAKRLRYESMGHLPVYPQRPGERDCAFYMQTRTCKYGEACRFDHPIWIPEGGIPDWQEVPPVPCESLPERPGEPDCPYFLKTQRCKFGNNCKFNHPRDSIALPGANAAAGDVSILPERPSEPPCAFYMKTGNCKFGMLCKFHHPKDVQIQPSAEENAIGNVMIGDANPTQQPLAPPSSLNMKGLPIRVGVEDCPFYLKTGSCKYGISCRYNHPDRIAINMLADAVTPTHVTPPTTHFNFGVASPVASLLPTYHQRLNPTTLGLGPPFYPQRPGELECDFYMKTGICKFATNCKFHHPIDRSAHASSTAEFLQPNVKLSLAGLPRREGATHCPYYMKTGTCKYGASCRFDHPPPGEVMAMAAATTAAAATSTSTPTATATPTATLQGEPSTSAGGEAEQNGGNA